MLFYIKYGCSVSHESLIVNADDYKTAYNYAEQAAQDCYYSYSSNCLSDEDYDLYREDGLTEEEISDQEYIDMLNDIIWKVEPYDRNNEEHIETMAECGGIPYEI